MKKWVWQSILVILLAACTCTAMFFLMLMAVLIGTNEEHVNPEACRDVGGRPAVVNGVLICIVIQQPAQNGET